MTEIAEGKLSSCGHQKKLRLRNCGVAVEEQLSFKSCGIAIAEVRPASCGIALADSKKSCACPSLIYCMYFSHRGGYSGGGQGAGGLAGGHGFSHY
jgi:hypothetical protein